jgi:hypothetical protein
MGETGDPCGKPQSMSKGSDVSPSSVMLADRPVKKDRTK